MTTERSVPSIIYDPGFYLKMEGGNEHFIKGEIEGRFTEAFSLGEVKKDMQVLDLGTGRGETTVLCAKNGAYVTAVDYSSDSIEMAKKFSSELLNEGEARLINFKVMDAKRLSFPEKSFDRIFFLEILEHLYPEELDTVLPKIKSLLKKDGKLILSTGPNALLIKPLIKIVSFLTGKRTWASREYHVNEQTYWQLKNLMAKYGFSVAKLKIGHSRNWIYGQTEGQAISPFYKTLARIINIVFDSYPVLIIRQLPYIDRLLGTHYLCVCIPLEKTNNGRSETNEVTAEKSYDKLHKTTGFGEEQEYYKVIGTLIKGKKSVDIGCGYGYVERYSPETVAVDFSEEALVTARCNGARTTVQATAESLPFSDNEFEVSISLGVLEHCEDQIKAVREMVRVSEIQILAVHARLPYGLEFIRKPLLSLFGLKDQPIEKPLTLEQIKRYLNQAGSRVIVEGTWNYVDLRWLWKSIPYGLIKWPSHHFLIAIKTSNLERKFLKD